MAKIRGKALKSLVLSSALVGAAIGVMVAIRHGFHVGVTAGAISALGWGVLMAITIICLQLFLTRNLTAEQSQPDQSCEFEVSGSVPAAMGLLVKSLSELRFVCNIVVNEKDGIISARTRRSFVSFGEEIAIKVTGVGKDHVRVTISSVPAMKFTVIDYGKNYRNIESIRRMLRSLGAEMIDITNKIDDRGSS
ncbi:MAG: hypothetical protein HY348_05165 [Nitrospira defluvii]|nr:hypothetical protein [Nitrospira defluvii]